MTHVALILLNSNPSLPFIHSFMGWTVSRNWHAGVHASTLSLDSPHSTLASALCIIIITKHSCLFLYLQWCMCMHIGTAHKTTPYNIPVYIQYLVIHILNSYMHLLNDIS